MKFKISWIEWHNPYNRADDDIREERYKNGVRDILESLPNSTHTGGDEDDNIEVECFDIFEAENIEEAKIKTKEYECGENNIFVVSDEKGNRIFTEEDVYQK